MKPKVTIVDYGAGNLHSVTKAFLHLDADVETVETPERIEQASCLILPGVGAYGEGMEGLRQRGLIEPLRRYAESGRRLIGICLGAQLLLEKSEEFGSHEGLGIVPGVVSLLPKSGRKIPHVGWCRVYPAFEDSWRGNLFEQTPVNTWMYFVHSYQCVPTDPRDCCALADYGGEAITAAVRKGNVVGLQFHPEKSSTSGLAMLRTLLRSEPFS